MMTTNNDNTAISLVKLILEQKNITSKNYDNKLRNKMRGGRKIIFSNNTINNNNEIKQCQCINQLTKMK